MHTFVEWNARGKIGKFDQIKLNESIRREEKNPVMQLYITC